MSLYLYSSLIIELLNFAIIIEIIKSVCIKGSDNDLRGSRL